MPLTSVEQLPQYRDSWEISGSFLMSRELVQQFDDFFNNPENVREYNREGLTRAIVGDYSQYESVEPMVKAYLGAKKCYDLYDRFGNDPTNPGLQQEIKSRLMEADLRAGFAMGGKQTDDPVGVFLKDCERIANREMMLQTLETPDNTAKLRLLEQLNQEDPVTAQENLNTMLDQDIEKRMEIAKVLFMNHLGKFDVHNDQQSLEMNENMAEVYAHGGRTMFILPAGGNQTAVMDSIQGQQRELSGVKSRSFATHGVEARTYKADGSIAQEAKELKLGGVSTFSPGRHRGMHASVGGLGQVGPNGKVITADGTNGHMYMHLQEGDARTSGMMLVGFENSGPGKKGRLGHAHDASAKKAGSSAFLSDKSYLGSERGGRVVDLSGISSQQLTDLLTNFENAYRTAARTAQAGDSSLLDACNQMLTGKPMSAAELKGMLQAMDVPNVDVVDAAKGGNTKASDYDPASAEKTDAIPMNVPRQPEKNSFRITEFEGFPRPQPPEVMKKPGFWNKVAHYLSFGSQNSYVNRYKEYQRTLAERMEAYNRDLTEYQNTLAALENGTGEEQLQAAYDQAVQQAKEALGIPQQEQEIQQEEHIEQPSNEQDEVARNSVTNELLEQLENALLDNLFLGVNTENASVEELNEVREEYRGIIRESEAFGKLVEAGSERIHAVLADPEAVGLVVADISNAYVASLEQNEEQISQSDPQVNHDMEMNAVENAPAGLGGVGMH